MAIQYNEKKSSLPTNHPDKASKEAFIYVKPGEIGKHAKTFARTLEAYTVIERPGRAVAGRTNYQDIETNISVRDQMTRADFDHFRSSESLPTKRKDILKQCMEACRVIGLVHNVIDLMGDFGAQGVQISHANPRQQKFYRAWFKKVKGPERTERALNYLYRCGTFIAKRSMAKISLKNETRLRITGKQDEKLVPDEEMVEPLQTQKRNIPIRYIFLNPSMLEVIGEELAAFIGDPHYALKISNKLAQLIKNPTPLTLPLIKKLPIDLVASINKGDRTIPLDPSKISVVHYKKDDWEVWADPMVYAILDDLKHLERMKLADVAALDGIISQVRVWKLGNLELGIFPTATAVQRLSDILLSNPGGGAFDLIWGPELSLQESESSAYEFLGADKYAPVMDRIFAGLGVPPTLTGAATASGFTNNYISLQTLIKRLEYGRMMITAFWEQEIELVRQAMGYQRGAKVIFDHMILTDERAMKALYIQLADRDMVSIDTVIERFGEDPETEQLKIRREMRARKRGVMNDKAGPWHSPEKIHEYVKAAIPRGFLSMHQTGIEFPVEYENDVTPFDKQLGAMLQKGVTNKTQKKGEPQQGRPKNAKDKTKRSTRVPKPLGASQSTEDFLATCIWARQAQQRISDIITPALLKCYGKKNQRALSISEVRAIERFKFSILANIPSFVDVTEDSVADLVASFNNECLPIDSQLDQLYSEFVDQMGKKVKRELTIDELRMIQISSYSLLHT